MGKIHTVLLLYFIVPLPGENPLNDNKVKYKQNSS